jgi:PAS domain S-box-containing protein
MILLDLILNIALLVALAAITQIIEARWRLHRLASRFFDGLLFGAVGVVGMMTPVHFQPGIIFDGRSIILAVGGLFGGPVVALIAALICGAYRLWLGGAGAAMGLGVILESTALGVGFHYWRRRAVRPMSLAQLWGFGLLVHGVMLGLVMLLPGGARQAVWRQLGLAIVGVYPVATTLVCLLFLDYEKQRRVRTEERSAVQALRESKSRLQAILDQAFSLVYVLDLDGRFTLVNRRLAALLGQPTEAIVGRTRRDLLPATIADAHRAHDLEVARTGKPVIFEEVNEELDGRHTYLSFKFPLHDEAGAITAVCGISTDVTERNRAEAALQDREMHLRLALDAARMGTWDWSLQTGRITWSPGHEALWGYAPGSFPGTYEAYESRLHPDDVEGARRAGQKALDGHSIYEHEYRVRWPDGTVRWIASRGQAFYGQDGKPTRMIGVAMDITERRRTEEALGQRFEELATLNTLGQAVNASLSLEEATKAALAGMLNAVRPDLAFLFLRDGERLILKDVMPAASRHRLGDVPEHRVGECVCGLAVREGKPIYSRDIFNDLRCTWNECKQAGIRSFAALPLTSGDEVIGVIGLASDTERDFERQGGFLETLANQISVALVNARLYEMAHRELAERKRAVQESRERAALLDAANDAIYVRALDHTITYWNAGAQRLYGWSPSEAMGRKITELGGLDPAAFTAPHTALLENGYWSGEMKRTSKDGQERIAFCRWTLLRDEQGQPKEVLAINTDITERKQLEAQFLRVQRMEGIGSLAGGLAHDLNNILTPILMSVPFLRETAGDSESREMLDTVKACAQRGADIIKQLLTFARGQPGARVPLPLRHLLAEMDKIVRETFPRNIHLVVVAREGLWSVLGDATQIHQALMNLCVNARDAMPDGGTLTLSAENLILDETVASVTPDAKPGAYVGLSVADTGTGIPREQLDRIFDPFFTTKEIGQGTGLGLSTVLGIVRGHGGFVRLDSQVGQGTRFELFLPAVPEPATVDAPTRDAPMPPGHGELILVVDDEAAVRSVAQRILEKHGYRVLVAAEGGEAMTIFNRHRAEVRAVLADMMMPGMDGPALMRALRQTAPRLPILVMTGLAAKVGYKGLEGFDQPVLLPKPFSVRSLLDALHQTLSPPVSK